MSGAFVPWNPAAPDERRCTKCLQSKLLIAFRKEPRVRSGFKARCRECESAYRRKRDAKLRELYAEQGQRLCPDCRENKPLSAFVSNSHTLYCKACNIPRFRAYRAKNRDRLNTQERGRHHAKQRRYQDSARRWAYGLTPERFDTLFASQNGKCAICSVVFVNDPFPLHGPGRGKVNRKGRATVDHDHTSGAIRGLLCNKCNQGLGAFGDTLDGILRAAEYLGFRPDIRRQA